MYPRGTSKTGCQMSKCTTHLHGGQGRNQVHADDPASRVDLVCGEKPVEAPHGVHEMIEYGALELPEAARLAGVVYPSEQEGAAKSEGLLHRHLEARASTQTMSFRARRAAGDAGLGVQGRRDSVGPRARRKIDIYPRLFWLQAIVHQIVSLGGLDHYRGCQSLI